MGVRDAVWEWKKWGVWENDGNKYRRRDKMWSGGKSIGGGGGV